MPCCCATNVKAAFVLGIVLAVLSLINGINGTAGIITGILGALINCILIFGAHKRNSTAILVWMVLAIIECIGIAIYAIFIIVVGVAVGAGAAGAKVTAIAMLILAIVIVFSIGIIILLIWTIIVAKNARKEIENTDDVQRILY